MTTTTQWVIVPAPWKVNAPPKPEDQKWLFIMTGIADVNQWGTSSSWVHIKQKVEPDWKSPVSFAYGTKPPTGAFLAFQAEQWASYATINSISDDNEVANFGFAVDSCQPIFAGAYQFYGGAGFNRFDALELVLGMRDTNAYINKVGYHITMLGKIIVAKI